MKKSKGMILICTLAIMVILSIFLMVTVHRMQSSSLVTKRMMWDIKSYWATVAGNNVAADSCIYSENFPYSSKIPFNTTTPEYGGYRITVEDEVVKGEDTSSASSFTINYKNNIIAGSSSNNHSSGLSTSLQLHFDETNATKGEIYFLTVGQSGPTVCGTDFIYNINNTPNTTFNNNVTNSTITNEQATFIGAAIYVAGSLDINVKNYFTILQKDGTRGCIVSGGDVEINSEQHNQAPTWERPGGLSIGGGSIFAGSSCKINGKDIPLGDSSNFTNYGVSVYQKPNGNITALNNSSFKDLNGIDLPSGIWAFMETPKYTDIKKNEFIAMCNAVNAICPENGEADTSQITTFESYLNENENYRTWLQCDKYTKEDRTDAQKAYVASKFNQVFKKLEDFNGKYVPVFLPDRDSYNTPFQTRAKLSPSSINSITYAGMMNALVNGVVSEEKIEAETINLPSNSNTYVLNTLKDKTDNNFYLLRANSDNTLKTRIEKVGREKISFSAPTASNEYLTMQVNGNLESKDGDSFFSFAVFERNPESFSNEYKDYLKTAGESDEIYSDYAINQLMQKSECFVPANDRRGKVKLGDDTNSDNSIVVDKMHIKGSITGQGSLRAKEKDITFEGVGSGISSGNSLVSMWAADDIKIYQTSAANSSIFASGNESSANFRGILYAHDKIRINVGSDNLNFNLSGVIITTKTSSGDGFLEVYGINNFTITYDPDISGEILEKYINGWQTMTDSLSGSGGSGSNTNTNTNATVPTGKFKAFNRI